MARIPTCAALISLVLGVALCISSDSDLDLARQTQRRRWRRLCGLKDPISDDTFESVTERLSLEDLRHSLAHTAKTLQSNKALESRPIQGLLFLSLDANEHFKSRSRCCESCCQRPIEETDAEGPKHPVTECYHRDVLAQINGPQINVLLDVEPIRPGEEECAAALRLLGRVRRLYGPRFFDAITVDAWYVQGPFLRAVEKLGWAGVVVLKQERLEVLQEARPLSQGQKPPRHFQDEERDRDVRLWEIKDLAFSQGYGRPVRVMHSQEQWTEKKVVGGKKTSRFQSSHWWWMASEKLACYGGQVIYQAGHRRWGIENKAFNELTQSSHLEHCSHHAPVSRLAQMLILWLGFTLFTAFAEWHNKLVRLGQLTAKALAKELDLALEEDLPWEQWFHSG